MATNQPSTTTPEPSPPSGFEESDQGRWASNTDSICFLEQNRRGYLLLKKAATTNGQQFWHIERWVRTENNGFNRDTSTPAKPDEDLAQLLENEATSICKNGYLHPKYHS